MTQCSTVLTKKWGNSLIVLLLTSLLAHRAVAQGDASDADAVSPADSLQRQQLVQLSPHVLHFDRQTTTATIEFRNVSDLVKQATVLVQFAYQDVPHGLPGDTIIIDSTGRLTQPHDTVIATPGPTDHFAGRWLTGVPTQVTLAPHQSKRITVHLTPPPTIPAGEYWARIVARVRPTDPRHGNTRDVQKRYALPTMGHLPYLQDTCAVIYRQGTLHMGLEIGPSSKALIDSTNVGGAGTQNFSHALWVLLPIKLTGNVPFRGMIHSQYVNVTTGEIVNPDQFQWQQYKDGVLHMVVETDVLAPGSWDYTVTFDNAREDIPQAERLPMSPVQHAFRFEIKPAWAYP